MSDAKATPDTKETDIPTATAPNNIGVIPTPTVPADEHILGAIVATIDESGIVRARFVQVDGLMPADDIQHELGAIATLAFQLANLA